MNFNDLLLSKHLTQKALSELSGVPRTTIVDLCTHKSFIKKCNGETIYKLAKALKVSMEYLIELDNTYDIDPVTYKPKDNSYLEKGLPSNVQSILRKMKNALINKNLLKYDLLHMELEQELMISLDNGLVTDTQVEYLLTKYGGA